MDCIEVIEVIEVTEFPELTDPRVAPDSAQDVIARIDEWFAQRS